MTVAGALLRAAYAREETRGAHARRDFPWRDRNGAHASSIRGEPTEDASHSTGGRAMTLGPGGRNGAAHAEAGAEPWPSSGPPDPPGEVVREAVTRALAEDVGAAGRPHRHARSRDRDRPRPRWWRAPMGCWPVACARSRPSLRSTRRSRWTGRCSTVPGSCGGRWWPRCRGPCARSSPPSAPPSISSVTCRASPR